MIHNRALRAVEQVHSTRRLLVHWRGRRRARHDADEVRVEVLVQRRAIAEDLAERRDGIRRAREDRENILAIGER